MTRERIEKALDEGRVFFRMNNGNWWKARRNGMTKIWKTRPGEFKIPVKMGIREYGYINQDNMSSEHIKEVEL